MKVAILETVKAHAGFELEFDRIIIEALQEAGHEPVMMLPEETVLDQEFAVDKYYLTGGKIVSYDGIKGVKKIWYSYLREKRRIKWFDAALDMAHEEHIDAIVLTTATYRYLRSLQKSRLRDSDIPVYFIFLGVNPQEMPKFMSKAQKCLPYRNVHLCITTLRDDFGNQRPENVRLIKPPVMIPRMFQNPEEHDSLRIGFFGHYRKGEKNIDWLINLVRDNTFNRPVKFVIQLAPTTDEDRKDIDEIIVGCQGDECLEFIPKTLLQDEWYKAIQSVDVVFLPYTAERYLYNWSAIYFTAIGAQKPVITTSVLNPEVMAKYKIGKLVNTDDYGAFCQQMVGFINCYDENKGKYKSGLIKAKQEYGKLSFINNLFSN